MVNAALSECALPQVPSPPVCLNITDNDKTKAAASPSSAAGAMFNLRKRLRTRYLTDAFIVVVGKSIRFVVILYWLMLKLLLYCICSFIVIIHSVYYI